MNYSALFSDSGLLDGGDFCCCYCRRGGAVELPCRSRYPLLFVLQGTSVMRFKYGKCTVGAGNLLVIDVQALAEFSAEPGTVVLIYRPPERLVGLLAQCSLMYDTFFSGLVPILPPLQAWIERLLAELLQNKAPTDEDAYVRRRELARILVRHYPRRLLGELSAAFLACMLGDCEKCRSEMGLPLERTSV